MMKFGIRLTAILETCLFLAILFVIGEVTGQGRFLEFTPHPLWLIILLIAGQYGTREALLAVFLSTLFLYVDNLPKQGITESEFAYNYRLAWRPTLWFIVAFLLGELRARLDNTIRLLTDELDEEKKQSTTLAKAYEATKEIKEKIEKQLASQLHTTAKIYDQFKSFDTLSPAKILLSLDTIVLAALDIDQFSVFALGENGLESTTCHGWDERSNYSRRLNSEHPIYKKVVEERKFLSIVNEEDAQILGEEGILAAPLIDKDRDEVFGIFKVEKIPFEDFNIVVLQTITTLCELIGSAYSSARHFKAMEKETMRSKYALVHSSSLLKSHQKLMTPLVSSLYDVSFTFVDREKQTSHLFEKINEVLPDNLSIYLQSEGCFSILIPNVTQPKAEEVASKLLQAAEKEAIKLKVNIQNLKETRETVKNE